MARVTVSILTLGSDRKRPYVRRDGASNRSRTESRVALNHLLRAWRGEVEAHAIYAALADCEKDSKRSAVLRRMSEPEEAHRRRIEDRRTSEHRPGSRGRCTGRMTAWLQSSGSRRSRRWSTSFSVWVRSSNRSSTPHRLASPWSRADHCRQAACWRGWSRISRTFFTSTSGVKGFWRKAVFSPRCP